MLSAAAGHRLGVIVGILEVLLSFWVSQRFFVPPAIPIITWVGMAARLRGMDDIVVAFEVRRVGARGVLTAARPSPRALASQRGLPVLVRVAPDSPEG